MPKVIAVPIPSSAIDKKPMMLVQRETIPFASLPQ
jgi:hypothetical protein